MSKTRTIASIILAAGKGTRMRDNNALHKVCYTVQGVPVIHTSLATYERCGLDWHLLVVGNNVEQVMQTVEAGPTKKVLYCLQAEQKGTAHATRIAANLMEMQGFDGDILVVAGDKVLEEGIVRRLLDDFYANDRDLAFVVGNIEDFADAGRIITDAQGEVIGNVEVFDCDRIRLMLHLREQTRKGAVPAADVEALALKYFKTEKKASKALGPIWELLQQGKVIDQAVLAEYTTAKDYVLNINGQQYPPALMDSVRFTNLSVYLFKAQALYRTLKGVGSANAQNEEYLPDVIGMLKTEGANVSMVPLEYPEECMAFNTPEELAEIERYYAAKAIDPSCPFANSR